MNWYAVQITTNHEKKIKKILSNIEDVKEIIIPDWKGYIFVKSEGFPMFRIPNTYYDVLGVVDEEEVFRSINKAKQQKLLFKKGDIVKFKDKMFENYIGKVLKAAHNQVQLSVVIADQEVKITVDPAKIEKIDG